MKCVCVEGVEERPIYSSRGRFPANTHVEGDQVPWQPLLLQVPWQPLLLEVHLDGNQARFGRPWKVIFMQRRLLPSGTWQAVCTEYEEWL